MRLLHSIGLLATAALLLVAAPAPSAQQGGTAGVGIIGGVQPGQFPTAGRVKVTQPGGPEFTVPLNGIRNFLVFYAPDASGNDRFAPAGSYGFEYQTIGGSHAAEFPGGPLFSGFANYQPDPRFSRNGIFVTRDNGVVQRPNISQNPAVGRGALGIQGFVQNDAGTPLFNALVQLFRCNNSSCSSTSPVTSVRTNGGGFYSFYYTAQTTKNFIQPGLYWVRASASGLDPDMTTKQYSPVTDPSSPDFFVLGAQESAAKVRNLVLSQPLPPPTGCMEPYASGSGTGGTETNALPIRCPHPYASGPEAVALPSLDGVALPTAVPVPGAAGRFVFGPAVVGASPSAAVVAGTDVLGSLSSVTPTETALLGSWPNPVSSQGSVRFSTETESDVQLDLYDVLGRKVASLAEGTFGAGHHEAVLEADRLPPGTYVLRLTAGGQVRTTRVTVAR